MDGDPEPGLLSSSNFGFSMVKDFLGTVLIDTVEICLIDRLPRLSSGCGVLGIRDGISSLSKVGGGGDNEGAQSGESG